jgi:hypothetical protein
MKREDPTAAIERIMNCKIDNIFISHITCQPKQAINRPHPLIMNPIQYKTIPKPCENKTDENKQPT